MKIVYIASPYTVGDVAVNVKTQMDTADSLIEKGYCPIVEGRTQKLSLLNR